MMGHQNRQMAIVPYRLVGLSAMIFTLLSSFQNKKG